MLFLGAAGCASSGPVEMHLDQDSTATLLVADGAGGLRVHTAADRTIVLWRGSTYTFTGHRGVRGDFGSSSGTLVIGAVTLRYDAELVSYAGPAAHGEVAVGPLRRLTIDQSGAACEG